MRELDRQTLEGSLSAVSKPKFASKYAFESSRRDLHNELLCTVLEAQISLKSRYFFCKNMTLAKCAGVRCVDLGESFLFFPPRRELSNAYLLAKFGVDTAENEPYGVCNEPCKEPPALSLRKLPTSLGALISTTSAPPLSGGVNSVLLYWQK